MTLMIEMTLFIKNYFPYRYFFIKIRFNIILYLYYMQFYLKWYLLEICAYTKKRRIKDYE
ncbi:MAG: hypothetical protein RL284_1526 [Bacteroidota bacterium]|jgi:hypothetical protein